MLFFEDVYEGQEIHSPGRTVTEADVVNFAGISGDFNSLHTDEEYAKQSLFGRRIAHGLLTLAMASGLSLRGPLQPENVIAFYGMDKLRFTHPVHIGDTIYVTQRVTGKRPSEKTGGGLVTLECTVKKQQGQTVLRYDAKFLLKSRAPAKPLTA